MKRVLVIRCGALGDLVYATSVIDALRYEFGEDVVIDFVATPGSGTLFKNDARINQVFPLKHKKLPLLLSPEKKKIIHHSKQKPYDILINFEYGKQFKSLLKNIVAKQKIGATFQDIKSLQVNRGEMIKQYLTPIISPTNLTKAYPTLVTLQDEDIRKKFELPQDYIVIAPSNSHIKRSGINYRAWPNEHWRILMKQLDPKVTLVIVGANGEEKFFKQFHPYPSNVVDLVGKNSISELATIVKNAQATICTDSAVGHISAAVNTPVFVLMGPNDTHTDSPYQTPYNQIIPISLHLHCSPCYKTEVMKQCKDNICMSGITPQQVIDSLKEQKIID